MTNTTIFKMAFTIDPKIIYHLSKDPILKPIIEHCPLNIYKEPVSVMDDLLSSVISQQLSTKAAASIHERFVTMFPYGKNRIQQLLNTDIETYRSIGLSAQKSRYIKNIITFFEEHQLHDIDWSKWSDDEIVDTLVQIKGVGKWTAEMILIFTLFREDVLPLDDLIIRNNMAKLYNVTSTNRKLYKDLTAVAEPWRPYRSIASRYIWAAENTSFVK